MKRIVMLILIGSFSQGCATMWDPSQASIDAADYGPAPAQSEAEQLVEAAIRSAMRDPESARFRHGKARRGWAHQGMLAPTHYGWAMAGEYNAKNGFGGYVGFRRYKAVIHYGSLTFLSIEGAQGTQELPTVLVNSKQTGARKPEEARARQR